MSGTLYMNYELNFVALAALIMLIIKSSFLSKFPILVVLVNCMSLVRLRY